MCLIIDANVAHELCGSVSERARPLVEWLLSGKGVVVVGGKLSKELSKNQELVSFFTTLSRSGRLLVINSERIENSTPDSVGKSDNHIKSNDSHVIGLAMASGARLLFSEDAKLQQDFKNKKVISGTKGKVYSKTTHAHLLTESKLCPIRKT
jgi:hypothetical protein